MGCGAYICPTPGIDDPKNRSVPFNSVTKRHGFCTTQFLHTMASTPKGIQLLCGSHPLPLNDVGFHSATWKYGTGEGQTNNHSFYIVWQKSA